MTEILREKGLCYTILVSPRSNANKPTESRDAKDAKYSLEGVEGTTVGR